MREFFGHPMLAYAISAALNAGVFTDVLVSTEDAEIGEAARWYGAEYVSRPACLADDTATLSDVARHALELFYASKPKPSLLCQLMPNCPLVRSIDIREHSDLFNAHDRSFQISVVPYRSVYPDWALVADSEFRGSWYFGAERLVRSQDLSHTYCPTGAIWFANVEELLRQNAFYGNPFHLAPMDANRGIDIDDFSDWDLADLLVRGLSARDGTSPLEPVSVKSFAAGLSHA